MKLTTHGQMSVLETKHGEALFSYGKLFAVKCKAIAIVYYIAGPTSTTNKHINRFIREAPVYDASLVDVDYLSQRAEYL